MAALALTIVLVAYNNVANRWPPFNRGAYVPANVLAGLALYAAAVGFFDASAAALGVASATLEDLLVGAGLGAALTLPLFILASFERTRRLVADERVAGLGGVRLLYQVVIRVPVGTAAFEELAFRGVLFAVWQQATTTLVAAVVSSAAFGLWHIAPTVNLITANRPDASTRSRVTAVVATVVGMTGAGLALVWLRLETQGLAAPWGLHASLNSLATLGAVVAHRKRPAPAGTSRPG